MKQHLRVTHHGPAMQPYIFGRRISPQKAEENPFSSDVYSFWITSVSIRAFGSGWSGSFRGEFCTTGFLKWLYIPDL
jgi:hypothetical protein